MAISFRHFTPTQTHPRILPENQQFYTTLKSSPSGNPGQNWDILTLDPMVGLGLENREKYKTLDLQKWGLTVVI